MRAANGVFMAELTKKCKRAFGQSPASAGFADISLCCCAAWGWYITGVWRTRWARACPALPQRRHSSSAAAFPPCIFWCFWPRHFLKQNLALKTAVLVFLAGLCFVFANPPMQAPDETMHFLRAYAVGSGQFLFDEKQQFPNDVNLLVRDFPGAYINGVSGEKLAPDDPTIADAFARYSADKAAGAVAPARSPRCSSWCRTSPRRWAWPWDGCSARTRWPVCIWRARRTCCAMPYCAVTRLRSSGAFRPC